MLLDRRPLHAAACLVVHVLCLSVLCLVPAWAQAEGEDSEPINPSKNGTIQAEIPPTRESTQPPLTRGQLSDIFDEPNWDRGGPYIGLGANYSAEFSERIEGFGKFVSSGGGTLHFGVRHNRWLATHLNFLFQGPFKTDTVDFWTWGFFVGGRVYLTKTRLQPYIGLQGGFLQLLGADNPNGGRFGFVPRFAAGVDFFTTERFSVGLEFAYLYTVPPIQGNDFATLGLNFSWF